MLVVREVCREDQADMGSLLDPLLLLVSDANEVLERGSLVSSRDPPVRLRSDPPEVG